MAKKELKKFMIQSATHAQSGKGLKYMRFKLLEEGGKVHNATFFEDHEDLKSGMFVDVMYEDDEFNGEPQLKVSAMRETTGMPELFLPHTPYNVGAMLTELRGFVDSVSDRLIQALLLKALEDERWQRAAAATMVHHAYLGGLLEHTLNLVRLADTVSKLYPRLRRNLLIAGAMLHDIGKMDEMTNGINIEYTVEGNLFGHVFQGLLRIDSWTKELGFDEERRRLVLHLVAAHHGQQQYGAIKPPLVVEAQVLCDIDGLDAHLGAMWSVIDKAPAGREWSDKVKWETRYYLADFDGSGATK